MKIIRLKPVNIKKERSCLECTGKVQKGIKIIPFEFGPDIDEDIKFIMDNMGDQCTVNKAVTWGIKIGVGYVRKMLNVGAVRSKYDLRQKVMDNLGIKTWNF